MASMIRMSKTCPLKHSLEQGQDYHSHEDVYGDHNIISKKSLEQKIKQLDEVYDKNLQKWKDVQAEFDNYFQNCVKQLRKFREMIHKKIQETIKTQGIFQNLSWKDQKYIDLLIQNKYQEFSCQQMYKSHKIIKRFIQNSQNERETLIDLNKIRNEWAGIIQHAKSLPEVLVLKNKPGINSILHNQSGFSQLSSVDNKQEQQIEDPASMYALVSKMDRTKSTQSNKSISSSQSSFIRDESSGDKSSSFEVEEDSLRKNIYQKLKGARGFTKAKEKEKEKEKPIDLKEEISQIKQFYIPSLLKVNKKESVSSKSQKLQTQPSDNEEDDKQSNFQENYLKKLEQSERKLLADSTPQGGEKYYTILDMYELKQDKHFVFNTRVKVVKVVYQSMLRGHPKIKFIAGDFTGVGVFFTNYSPRIKAGAVVDLRNCKFSYFKNDNSIIEVRTDRNFHVIDEKKGLKIQPNLEKVRLNEYLTQNMQYNVHDSKCTLLKYAAKQLKEGKTDYRVSKMMVQILTIFQQTKQIIECLIADSSGAMVAYLCKNNIEKNRSLHEGDVLILRRVQARKRKQAGGQVIFIATKIERCKIYLLKMEMESNTDIISLQNLPKMQ